MIKLVIDFVDNETLEIENVTSYEVKDNVLKVFRRVRQQKIPFEYFANLGNFPIFHIRCFKETPMTVEDS